MVSTATIELGQRLADVLAPHGRIALQFCSEDVYRRFRVLEPALVSCLDNQQGVGAGCTYLLVSIDGEPAGALSFIMQDNPRKAQPANAFGRIDLVIVAERFRRLGLGRLLTLSALVFALEVFGRRLYSISCLAAHPAMEKILVDFGFAVRPKDDKNFVHTELKLSAGRWAGLLGDAVSQAGIAARHTSFRVRQLLGKA